MSEEVRSSEGAALEKMEDSKLTDEAEENRPLWQGNFSIWWLVVVCLGIWFLFIHAPQYLAGREILSNPLLYFHLVGSYVIYLACMWNVFHTPSHGPTYKLVHIWLGRIAMVCGYIGFIFGVVLSWGPGSTTPEGLAIGLTVGGVAQVLAQTAGIYSIYKYRKATDEDSKVSWLKGHIGCMIGVFLPACGTPAAMRLGGSLGLDATAGLGIFLTILVLMTFPQQWAIEKQRWY